MLPCCKILTSNIRVNMIFNFKKTQQKKNSWIVMRAINRLNNQNKHDSLYQLSNDRDSKHLLIS